MSRRSVANHMRRAANPSRNKSASRDAESASANESAGAPVKLVPSSSARLGVDPIHRLLWRISLPAAIAMGVNAVYNLADTLFVGRGVGGLGVGAIAVSFPITIMQISFGLVLGIGGGSLISRSLGAHRPRRAGKVLGVVVAAQSLLSILFTAVVLAVLPQLIRVLGATDELLPLALDYAQVITIGSVLNMHNLMFANLMRAEGRVLWSTTMFVSGALCNIILDAFFIFGLGMGVRGAAVATVISQALSFSIALYFYLGKKSEVRYFRARLATQWKMFTAICALGVGAAVRQWGEVVVLVIANNSLRTIGGSAAISAYGIVHRVVLFSLLPIVGVAQALLPIVGYNWGARQYDRAVAALRLGNRVSFFIGLPIALIEALLAFVIISVFVTDADIRAIGAVALRIMAFSIPFIPVQLNSANYFQAIGAGEKAVLIHGTRQFLFLVLFLLILGNLFGMLGIWSAFIIGDTLSMTMALLLFRFSNSVRLGKNRRQHG